MRGGKINIKSGVFSFETRILQVGRKIVYLHLPGKGILKMRNGVIKGYELGKSTIHMDYNTACRLEEQTMLQPFFKVIPKRPTVGHNQAWSK